ncbi:Lipocalin-like domain containing protein [Rhypophila sp. PSN 637]
MKVQHEDIIAALAGTYSLINNTVTRNGTIQPDGSGWGRNPSGLLTYTRWGYMSANMAATEPDWRPDSIEWPPKATDSDADWLLVGKHAMSYAGPFSLNASVPATKTQGQLLHGPMHVASVPSMVRDTQKRDYFVKEQDGVTYLYVYATGVSNGVDFRSEIVWQRVAKG